MLWVILIILLSIIFLIVFAIAIFFPGIFLIMPETGWLTEKLDYKLLTEKEVDKTLVKIKELRQHEQVSNSVLSRIGTASYMVQNYPDYLKEIERTNPVMKNTFGKLYDKIRQRLEEYTGKACKYAKWLARPGIHIFRGGSWLARGWSVASLHVDLQYLNIGWKYPVDYDKTISFTVPLQISEDCGLYLFNQRYTEWFYLPPYLWFNFISRQKVCYEVGKIYIHDGHTFHMISAFNSDKDRITVQGHAIYCPAKDCYYLYW